MNRSIPVAVLSMAFFIANALLVKVDAAEIGRAPLRLQKRPNVGYMVRNTRYKRGAIRISGTLVSIEGANTKGKSEKEIKALFKGPVGSTVKITYLDSSNKPHSVNIERTEIAKGGSKAIDNTKIRYFPRNLGNNHGVIWGSNLHNQSKFYEEQNLDLIVRAYKRIFVDNSVYLPKPNSAVVFKTAADAAVMLDTIGDMETADKYYELIVNNASFPKKKGLRFGSNFDTKLIKHSIDTGRIKESELIYDAFSKLSKSTATNNYQQLKNKWSLLKQRFQYLEHRDKTKALEIADKLLNLKGGKHYTLYNSIPTGDIEWLGNTFDRLGQYDKALKCFNLMKPMESLNKKPHGKLSLELVRHRGYSVLRKAQLLDKLDKTNDSIELLSELIEQYKQRLSPEQQSFAEKIALFFPARSDLELQLIQYYRKVGKVSEANTLEKALDSSLKKVDGDISKLKENSTDSLLASSENKSPEKFLLLRRIIDAINSGDQKKSKKDIQELVNIYENEEPVYGYKRKPLNTFTALVNISRKLADKERYRESEKLIDLLKVAAIEKERTPAAIGFIKIEEAMNSRSANPWSTVDNEALLAGKLYDYKRRNQSDLPAEILKKLKALDSLRRYAYIYYSAGLLNRAQKIQKHALEIGTDIKTKFPDSNLDIEETRAALFFDMAIVEAMLGKFNQSKNYSDKAVALLIPNVLGDKNRRGETFGSTYKNKTVLLASTLLKKGKVKSAQAILSAVEPKLEKQSINDFNQEPDSRVKSDISRVIRDNALVKYYVANVAHQLNDNQKAYTNINEAVRDLSVRVPFKVLYLAADISLARKNFAKAAHYFSEAERSSNYAMAIGRMQPGYREMLLQKAISCLDKVSDFDKSEKANIYIRLAALYQRDEKSKALNLYKMAFKLLPDKETRKAELATKIAWLESSLSRAIRNKKKDKTRKKLTAEEKENQQIESAKSRVAAMTQAAQVADKSKHKGAWSYWSRLAQTEAKAQMPQKAIEHTIRAIATYSKPVDIIYFRPIVNGPYGTVADLAKQGYKKDAESLLRKATEKVESLYGKNSAAVLSQKTQLFLFFMKQKEDQKALKELDIVLKADPKLLEIGKTFQNAESAITRWSAPLVKEKRGELVQKILNNLLAAQRRGLEPNHLRIANTLVAIAKVEKELGKYKEAEKTLREAFDIKKLYVGDLKAYTQISPVLIPVLKELGKEKEAKNLVKSKIDTRVANWPKGYVDPQHHSWGRGKVAKDEASLLKELDSARKQAPYSLRTKYALEELIQLARRNKDWNLLAKSATERAIIQEHYPDPYAGRRFGCTPPRFHRIDFYTTAAKAYLEMGNSIDANKWITRAVDRLQELASYEWQKLAEVAVKMKDYPKAETYLENAEKLITQSYYMYGRLSYIWRKMGKIEKAQELVKKEAAMKKERDEMYKKAKNSPFRGAH